MSKKVWIIIMVVVVAVVALYLWNSPVLRLKSEPVSEEEAPIQATGRVDDAVDAALQGVSFEDEITLSDEGNETVINLNEQAIADFGESYENEF